MPHCGTGQSQELNKCPGQGASWSHLQVSEPLQDLYYLVKNSLNELNGRAK